jgi:hypothetical protein
LWTNLSGESSSSAGETRPKKSRRIDEETRPKKSRRFDEETRPKQADGLVKRLVQKGDGSKKELAGEGEQNVR